MFDIGFSEIVVIGVTALIVIGPERLPKVARTMGHMFGRLQRYVTEVKADISREMELDELRKLQTQVKDAARDLEQSVSQATQKVDSELRAVEAQLNAGAQPTTAKPADHPPAGSAGSAPAEAALEAQVAANAESASAVAAAIETHPPQQSHLPGFDRI